MSVCAWRRASVASPAASAARRPPTCRGASVEELRDDLGDGLAVPVEQVQQDGGVEHRLRRPAADGRASRDGASSSGARLVIPTVGSGLVGRPAQRASAAASSSGLIGLDR